MRIQIFSQLILLSLLVATSARATPAFTTEVIPAGPGEFVEQQSDEAGSGSAISLFAANKQRPSKKFKSARHVVGWINEYQKSPTPDRVPDAIRALAKFGAFEDVDEA